MAIDMTGAVNAYKAAAKTAGSMLAGKPEPAAASGDNSFVNMATGSLKTAVKTNQQAEALSLKQISGEADLKDVITAVANAEHTLETVVAVRDKVLNAYQEILRMPI
ncbi:MAG: flagellar hook-basal body complex protein FliE [Rhodospirillaceae bacterium]|nr:flagellar hook-basal body complex protein FliE [Rhodospirillaceae bacterium]